MAAGQLTEDQFAYVDRAPDQSGYGRLREHLSNAQSPLTVSLRRQKIAEQVVKHPKKFSAKEVQRCELLLEELAPRIGVQRAEYAVRCARLATFAHEWKRYDLSMDEQHPQHSRDMLASATLLRDMREALCLLEPARTKCARLAERILGREL